MLKRSKPKHRSLLGVDISPTAVKILEISHSSNELCIKGYAYERLPSSAFETSRDNVVSCLKKLLTKINSSAKVAAIAVSDATVISKTIQLVDNLTELEMEELIFLEANNYLAYPPNKINIDYVVLGPSKKSMGMLDVLLVASGADNVRKGVELLKEAGLEVKIVDIKSYAIASVVAQLAYEAKQPKLSAVFDLGYESMSLFVLDRGKTIYTQEAAFGIRQLLEAIACHYQLSIEEALQLQEQKLRPADYELELVLPFIHSTIVQIKESLQHFLTSDYYKVIEGIFLMGEVLELTDLAERVQEETGILTVVANPFKQSIVAKNVNLDELSKFSPLFIVAFGLALRLINES